MGRVCPACSKVNPADACYCYYDGRALSDERQTGPVPVGSLAFPIPFCFADGQACANFNQLALVCDERWEEARRLLAVGYWPTFFGGIGRLDLVAAAHRAAAEPDADLGLSQLLEKLPADPAALRPPKPALEPAEKYLGLLTPGTDQTFEVTVINQGMLVLRGMIISNCEWLVLDEPGRPTQKMIQTRNLCHLKMRVLGKKLRAGLQALVGEIVIDTNGGAVTLPVRADVPIRPFPKNVYANNSLAGALSPHEIAVKAKEHPHDAAVLFELGAVKTWYETNGWTYPIEGSEASGKGAVQQFFEALGLTRPPLLKIDTAFMMFQGHAGHCLSRRITLSAEEPKPVYAHVWSDQDWVKFGPLKFLGNRVKIPVEITVPPRPGETVLAQITVRGNGKQQFIVPVTLTVEPLVLPAPALPAAAIPPLSPGLWQRFRERLRTTLHSLFGKGQP